MGLWISSQNLREAVLCDSFLIHCRNSLQMNPSEGTVQYSLFIAAQGTGGSRHAARIDLSDETMSGGRNRGLQSKRIRVLMQFNELKKVGPLIKFQVLQSYLTFQFRV